MQEEPGEGQLIAPRQQLVSVALELPSAHGKKQVGQHATTGSGQVREAMRRRAQHGGCDEKHAGSDGDYEKDDGVLVAEGEAGRDSTHV